MGQCEEECSDALFQAPLWGQPSKRYAGGNDGAFLGLREPQMGRQVGNEEGFPISSRSLISVTETVMVSLNV